MSRVVRRTDADMTKLTVAFRISGNTPKEDCPLNTPLTFHKKKNSKLSPFGEGNRFYYIIWPLLTLTHCRPEDEGSRFLRNVDIRVQVYTMSQPRIPQPQYYLLFRTSPPSCYLLNKFLIYVILGYNAMSLAIDVVSHHRRLEPSTPQ